MVVRAAPELLLVRMAVLVGVLEEMGHLATAVTEMLGLIAHQKETEVEIMPHRLNLALVAVEVHHLVVVTALRLLVLVTVGMAQLQQFQEPPRLTRVAAAVGLLLLLLLVLVVLEAEEAGQTQLMALMEPQIPAVVEAEAVLRHY